jgi:formylglycine-generating enzyme required for sulfatase activity
LIKNKGSYKLNTLQIMKRKNTILKIVNMILAILLFSGFCYSQQNNSQSDSSIQNIEKGINGTSLEERMQVYKVPGLSIAVINNYKIEWAKAYGTLNAETGVPVNTESLFEAASITKSLVAVTVLHFVEQELLDLDVDVNTYLKTWKIPENEFTKEKKVTLRLLLSHQSGLPMTNLPYDLTSKPSLVQVMKGVFPALNKPVFVENIPGAKWEYSNIGYAVIQLLLEDVIRKSLQQIIQETIFDPLEMNSSTLNYPLVSELQKNEALPHFSSGTVGEPTMHPTALAHGGLITTPTDLAKFTLELIYAYQGKSNKIVSQKTVKKMFASELDLDPAIFGCMLFKQGLGFWIQGKDQNIFFGHTGDNYPGATSLFGGIPEQGKGIVIMTNGALGLPLAIEIMDAITKEYNWPNFDEDEQDFKPVEAAPENDEDIDFVLIKGGTFQMGNTFDASEGDPDEQPVHTVTVNDFYMSSTEITFAQYDKYCELTGKEKPKSIRGVGRGDMPVMRITWFEAKAFCDYYGYRLPTEAEWEYAAREGGKKVRFGNGKDIAKDNEINFNAKESNKTAYSIGGEFRQKPVPVKSFFPNSLGLYGMSGNLSEWCQDSYFVDYYKNSPQNNPVCDIKETEERRILRGGHIFSEPKYIRCTHRDARIPSTRNWEFGFRVVKDKVK